MSWDVGADTGSGVLNYDACFSTVNAGCTPIAGTPQGSGRFLIGPKIFGYRDVDFQATKNFELGHGLTLYGRFDVLNVFNFRNYSDLIYRVGPNPYQLDTTYNPTGNITFVPRTFKFEVGMKF